MSDDTALSGYYWGTSSSTSPNYTSISGKNYTTTKVITNSGTYYLTVKDAAGNYVQTSITIYKTTFNANGGSVNYTSVLSKAGNTLTIPATRSGYTFKGWATKATATSGDFTIKPTGDNTYYAIWEADSTDTTKPSASISSTNNVASSQTVTLSMSDNVGLAGYYWGTSSSTSPSYTSISGKSYSTDKPVSLSGTYYLTVKDTSGNVYQTSATLYKTTLNANGGSVDINSVLTMSGNSFTPPTPTRDGYIFNGWSTSSTASSGSDSITPTGNHTYYATWRSKIPYSIIFDPESVTTYVGSSVTVSFQFTGENIQRLRCVNGDNTICTYSWGSYDFSAGTCNITFTGESEGSTSYTIQLKNSSDEVPYGKSISINVISEPSDAMIKASNVKGVAGKTVDVPVSLINNPGIVGATLGVKYNDSALELVGVTDTGVLGSSSHKPEYVSPYTLSWANDTSTENYTVDGSIAILTFKIKEGTTVGSYPVVISYDYDNYGIYDKDLNKINFSIENGSVDVSAYLCGDVNSDGAVNNLDRLYLTRYLANWEDYQDIDLVAADVDCSGTVNNLDRVILTRYLANWDEYSELPYLS